MRWQKMCKNYIVPRDVSRGKKLPTFPTRFLTRKITPKSNNLVKIVEIYPIDKLIGFQTMNQLEKVTHSFNAIFNLFFVLKRLPCNGLRKSKAQKTARYYNNNYIPRFSNPLYFPSKTTPYFLTWGWL